MEKYCFDRECGYIVEEDETVICFSRDIPTKLQDGPQ
jgi:hypothetical protein